MALTHYPTLCVASVALTLTLGCSSPATVAVDAETLSPSDTPVEDTATTDDTSPLPEPDTVVPVQDSAPEEVLDEAPDTEMPIQNDATPDTLMPTVDATTDAGPDPQPDATPDSLTTPMDTAADAETPVADSDPGEAEVTDDVPPVTDTAQAPIDPLAGLPTCAGNVVETAIASPLPKSAGADAFTPWDGVGWYPLLDTIVTLYQGGAETVLSTLESAGYTACRGVDDESNLVLFAPATPDTGHARAVWRFGAARPVVLEAPHPVYDMQTANEAAYLFETTQARGLIASGTHRCVSDIESGCDGKTKACSTASEPYTITDMAHVTQSFFQVFHGAFEFGLQQAAEMSTDESAQDYLFISVHGMSGDGISMSNGTTEYTHAEMVPAKLTLALMTALPDAYVTSCNDFEGAVVDERLCGTTNTQGRWTNGSDEPCMTGAAAASQRFAHMEQALEIRQNPEPVAEALMAVFDLSD